LPISQIDAWARYYLSSYFTCPLSRFHNWLGVQLQDLHTRRGSHLALVAPRGSAKSTWVSLAYPLWAALHRYEPYILIISDSQAQARLHLEAVKQELEDNSTLAEAYPAAVGRGSPWGQDRIRLANGVVIEALGTGSKIRGRRNRAERPSLIVVDDPENDNHVTSAMQRDGIQAFWIEKCLSFDAGMLKRGRNTIQLHSLAQSWSQGVMYDCVRLELDDRR